MDSYPSLPAAPPSVAASPAPTLSPEQLFKASVQKLYAMRLIGCHRTCCTEKGCVSNPQVTRVPPAEAAGEALKLAYAGVAAPPNSVRFCVDDPVPQLSTARALQLLEPVQQADAVREFGLVFSHPDALNLLFLQHGVDTEASERDAGIDRAALARFYAQLLAGGEVLRRVLCNAFEAAAASLRRLATTTGFFRLTLKGLRLFEIVLSFPPLVDPQYHRCIVVPVLEIMATLEARQQTALATWWSLAGADVLEARLALLHQVITLRILLPPPLDTVNSDVAIVAAVKSMGLVHRANALASSPVRFTEFYNETLNESIDIQRDFLAWTQRQGFSFCQTPFVLAPDTKALVLRFESRVAQIMQRERALRMAIHGGQMQFNPYLVFSVRRDHMIPDTLESIVRVGDAADLKKELKIKFVGEEGIDAGGVQKEFFQLIVRDIFNPDFGMWVLDSESRRYWFNSNSTEMREFELIGTILGLAIYNSVILDVHFPPAAYKKLMGLPVSLDDLRDVAPTLHRGLVQLLAFEGNVEETYMRDFQVEYEYYGAKMYHELKPGGAAIPLTNANRDEYVRLFVDYQLNKSIERQFAAFKKGFDLVLNGPAFALFSLEELELVICGDPVLDFDELEKAAQYESDEFDASHAVVKWFWEVVHALPEEQRRKLLHFATGSDRAPIGGLKNLHLVIQRHGDGDERLPSSHTCFNHLLLPVYTSKEALRAKLLMALENSTGFGLR